MPSKDYFLQYVATLSGTLAIVTDGMHYGWPSPTLPQLKNDSTCAPLCISESEGSWLAVMPLIGAVFGSISAALVVDRLGRKRVILGTAVPFLLAWFAIAVASSPWWLHGARFWAGVADGVSFTVVPMYIGEIAHPSVRGLLGSACSVLWIAGFLIINILGSYFSIRTTALVSAVVPALLLITFPLMPESPYYLIMSGNKPAAQKALQHLTRQTDVSADIERISSHMSQEKSSSPWRLFTVPSNRRAVLIMMGLRGFQQLSGTTAIAFYTHEIFAHSDDILSLHWAVMIYYTVQLAMTILSSSVVDRAGRKPLMLLSLAGAALMLLMEACYFYISTQTSIDIGALAVICPVGLIGFVILFGLGMQSIPILMLGELFSSDVKASALCLADIYYSVMAITASKFLQITKDSYGLHVTFLGFGISAIAGIVFIVLFVPETKGKTLEDIQIDLGQQPNDDNQNDTSTLYPL